MNKEICLHIYVKAISVIGFHPVVHEYRSKANQSDSSHISRLPYSSIQNNLNGMFMLMVSISASGIIMPKNIDYSTRNYGFLK